MSRSIFHTIKVHRLEEAYARGEKKMKVLLINGSPHEKGCTYPALDQMNKYFLHGQMLVPGSRYWNMVHGMAVLTQLERLDFTDKMVFAVMTHEGSGLGGSECTLKASCKGATIGKGLAVHGADAAKSEATVAAWAKKSV